MSTAEYRDSEFTCEHILKLKFHFNGVSDYIFPGKTHGMRRSIMSRILKFIFNSNEYFTTTFCNV